MILQHVCIIQEKRMIVDLSLIEAHDITHSSKKIMKCFSVSSLNFKSGSNEGIFYLDMARRGNSKVRIPIKKDLSRALFIEA